MCIYETKKKNIATKNKIINLNEMDHLTKTFNRNKGLEILENTIKKITSRTLPSLYVLWIYKISLISIINLVSLPETS